MKYCSGNPLMKIGGSNDVDANNLLNASSQLNAGGQLNTNNQLNVNGQLHANTSLRVGIGIGDIPQSFVKKANNSPFTARYDLLTNGIIINTTQQKQLLLILFMLLLLIINCQFNQWLSQHHRRLRQQAHNQLAQIEHLNRLKQEHEARMLTLASQSTALTSTEPYDTKKTEWVTFSASRKYWQHALQAILPELASGRLHQLKIAQTGSGGLSGNLSGNVRSWQELEALNSQLSHALARFKLTSSQFNQRKVPFTGHWELTHWELTP